MKRVFCLLAVVSLLLSMLIIPVSAQDSCERLDSAIASRFVLRAGGGTSGGSGGSFGGSSSGSHSHNSNHRSSSDPFSMLFGLFLFLLIGSASAIVFRFRLSRSARNTKKLMTLLHKKDSAWKYKHIQRQVRDSYFAIQKAWSHSDMQSAKQHMSDNLYDTFQTQLNWMKVKNQRNVLKNVRLREAIPVSVHDDRDDSLDHVWFYIKGRMIDYTVDTQTNQRLEGSPFPESFGEYWQFIRTEGDRWVLNQILQEDRADEIAFTAD